MSLFLMSAPGATSPCPSATAAGPVPREWHTWGWDSLVPPGCPAAGWDSGTIHIWETLFWRVPLLLAQGSPWELLLPLMGSPLLCFECNYILSFFVFSTLFKQIIPQRWAEWGNLFSPWWEELYAHLCFTLLPGCQL